MIRSLTVTALLSVSPVLAATPTHVATKTLLPADGGFTCSGDHRTDLDNEGRSLVTRPGDRLARQIRDHFSQRDLVRAHVNPARGGFDVQYDLDPDVAADAEFVAALGLAADVWEAQITDDVTIVIEVGFVSNVGYIGAASSNRFDVDYDEFRAAAIADAGDAESAFVGALPNPDIDAETNGGFVSSSDFFFDGIEVTTANARALGFPVNTNDPDFSDASIVFNTDFDFDNDPSDGLTEDSIDTVYVMIHEIGHMLGFISSVDGFSGGDYLTALDTFRVGINGAANDPANLADFSVVAREGRAGVEAALDHVDAVPGAPLGAIYQFSTGSFGGDGRQASHWKDDVLLKITPNIGVMDPTTSSPNGSGQGANPGYITYADKLAFSVIGWDINLDPAPCAGDLNGDNAVGSDDLAALLAQWGGSGSADFDGNGVVDAGDLAILLATWGVCD